MSKTADVIITIYDPDEKFSRLLAALRRQTVLPGRLILMLTESVRFDKTALVSLIKTQDTGESVIIKQNAEKGNAISEIAAQPEIIIHTLPPQEFDHGATRHLGSAYSDADYLIYMTQDAIPAEDTLIENLLTPFTDPQVSAAYARQLCGPQDGEIERYTHEFNYPAVDRKKTKADINTLGIKAYFCSDVCAAYRREVYEKMGGFVRKTIFNEDMLMAAAMIGAGYAVYYCAKAMVYHSHSYTAKQQFMRNFDLGVSHKQYDSVFGTVPSESEGIRLVKNTAKHLIKKKRYLELPKLVIHSGCKYVGYLLGKHYDKLPLSMVRACSMCRHYWG